MPNYKYMALSENGATVTGEAAADSEESLRADLSAKGLLAQEVQASRAPKLWGRVRVKVDDFALFNQEFTALVRAGLTVPNALALAGNRPDTPILAQILDRVHAQVQSGVLLSQACAAHPEAFDSMYVAALKTSEKTGNLVEVLLRYQDYLKYRLAMRKRVMQALTYPIFLLATLVVILAVLFAFVLPRFVAMYADLGGELPLPTRILLGVVTHAYVVVPAAVVLIVLGALAWRRGMANPTWRRKVDAAWNRLPYIGNLLYVAATARIARSLATLLAAGTPLVEALRTASGSIAGQTHIDRLRLATQKVVEGDSLAAAVRATTLMSPTAARMIEVGEASGGLDGMLGEVARFHEELLDARMTRIMNLVEPVLMLLMGVLIGGIIIVMYLPIFHVADIIK
jgi:type IV pilus assembly protein PilC